MGPIRGTSVVLALALLAGRDAQQVRTVSATQPTAILRRALATSSSELELCIAEERLLD